MLLAGCPEVMAEMIEVWALVWLELVRLGYFYKNNGHILCGAWGERGRCATYRSVGQSGERVRTGEDLCLLHRPEQDTVCD